MNVNRLLTVHKVRFSFFSLMRSYVERQRALVYSGSCPGRILRFVQVVDRLGVDQ